MLLKKMDLLKKMIFVVMSIVCMSSYSFSSFADVDPDEVPDYIGSSETSGSSGGSSSGGSSSSGSYSGNSSSSSVSGINDGTENFNEYSYSMTTNTPEENFIIPVSEFKKNPKNFEGKNVVKDPQMRKMINIIYEREGTEKELEEMDVTKQMMENLIYLSPEQCKAHTSTEIKIKDITGLEYAKNLEWLSLVYQKVEDLTPIKNLTKLRHLDLRANTGEKDMSKLSNLTNLEYLDIRQTHVENIDALKSLTKMKMLIAFGDGIDDISFVKDMNDLVSLDLGENVFTDISPLQGKKKLEYLNISRKVDLLKPEIYYSDIDVLKESTKLKFLNIADNKVSDLSVLSNMNDLKYLTITNNIVSDLSPISGAKKIKRLWAEGNLISSLEPIKDLKLNSLNIKNNKIKNLDSISNMYSLEVLAFDYCDDWSGNLKESDKAILEKLAIPNITFSWHSNYKIPTDGKTYEVLDKKFPTDIEADTIEEAISKLPNSVEVTLKDTTPKSNTGSSTAGDLNEAKKQIKLGVDVGFVVVDENNNIVTDSLSFTDSYEQWDGKKNDNIEVENGVLNVTFRGGYLEHNIKLNENDKYEMVGELSVYDEYLSEKGHNVRTITNNGQVYDLSNVDMYDPYDLGAPEIPEDKKDAFIIRLRNKSSNTPIETPTENNIVKKNIILRGWEIDYARSKPETGEYILYTKLAAPSNYGNLSKELIQVRAKVKPVKNVDKDSNGKKSSNVYIPSYSSGIKEGNDSQKIDRVSGEDRVATSVNVSKKYFKKADTVVIASSKNTKDALIASSVARKYSSPILLLDEKSVGDIRDEVSRLGANKIIVIGGENSIGNDLINKVSKGNKVDRISGEDRVETSIEVAKTILPKEGGNIIVVSSKNDFDAVSAGVISASTGAPILVYKESNEAIDQFIKSDRVKSITVLGGEDSVPKGFEKKYSSKNIERLAGRDRYQTSFLAAKNVSKNPDIAFVVSGKNVYDAMVVSSASSKEKAPFVLVGDKISEDTSKYLENTKITIIGGEVSISDSSVRR